MKTNEYKPLVSIITVVYNCKESIERTINSVLEQTYKNIEYIIIDGISNDGTIDIIKKYEDKITKIVSEKDQGIADAMNKGISLSSGSIIGLINANDWFETDAIEKIVILSNKFPDSIIHGDMRVYYNDVTFYLEKAPNFPNLFKGMELNHPTVFVPKVHYDNCGYFDLNYKIVFDWELMLRFKFANITFVNIHEIIANFSVGGVSTLKARELVKEMHVIRKKYSLYLFFDKYYLKNQIRLFFFGSNLVKVSQKIRLIKYNLFLK